LFPEFTVPKLIYNFYPVYQGAKTNSNPTAGLKAITFQSFITGAAWTKSSIFQE